MIVFSLAATFAIAQGAPDLSSPARDFYNTTLRPLFPFVVAGILLIGGAVNIGKLLGQNTDYRGFFSQIAIYAFGALILVAIVEFVARLTVGTV